MAEDRETRLKRLRYRSWHRGTKELDLLMGPFADSELAGLDSGALDDFESLMEAPEPLLYAMLTGKASPPPEHDHETLRRLLSFLERPRSA